MILPAHNFWSCEQLGRRNYPYSQAFQKCPEHSQDAKTPGNSKVSDPEIAVLVDEMMLWLDIPVEDVFIVDVLQTADHAGK